MSIAPTRFGPLDRRIIAALQVDGRASWTEIAERTDTSVATAMRRGQNLLGSGALKVGVSSEINATGDSDLFMLRIGCTAGRATQVARTLAERHDLRFLCLVTGGCDLLAELVCRKSESLHARLINEIQAVEGVEFCVSDLVMHTYKISQRWSRQLLPEGSGGSGGADGDGPADGAAEPHVCSPDHFDEVDRVILGALRDDGRASFRSVAEVTGVNESTVRRRFDAMRERGCALVITLVAASALGFESEILLTVSVDPARLEAVAHELAGYRGVRFLAATASCSLICEVIMPSTQDVYEFLTQGLGRIDGVRDWQANVELLTVKRGFLETPWWQESAGAAAPPEPAVDALPTLPRRVARRRSVGTGTGPLQP